MAVTDTEVLNAVIYRVMENGAADANGTLMTSMFSVPQIVDAMNQRQWKFLKDTGCIASRQALPSPAGQPTYGLTNDYIDTLRLAYKPNGGQYYSLQRVDSWEIDNGSPEWNYSTGDPSVWNESTQPTRTLNVAPLPSNTGTLSHLYVAVSATLTGLGVALVIPETFSWAITWGVIADLLSSDGEAFDPKRASYAEQRYQQGVELCRLLIEGVTVNG